MYLIQTEGDFHSAVTKKVYERVHHLEFQICEQEAPNIDKVSITYNILNEAPNIDKVHIIS